MSLALARLYEPPKQGSPRRPRLRFEPGRRGAGRGVAHHAERSDGPIRNRKMGLFKIAENVLQCRVKSETGGQERVVQEDQLARV